MMTSVSGATAWLRASGGQRLASRLSAFSKLRNRQAHPDPGLGWDLARHGAAVAACTREPPPLPGDG